MPPKSIQSLYIPAAGDKALHTAVRNLSLPQIISILRESDVEGTINAKNDVIPDDHTSSGGDTPLHIAVAIAVDKEATGGDTSSALDIVRTLLQHECFQAQSVFCAENAARRTPWDDVYNIPPPLKRSSELFKLLVEHGGSSLHRVVLDGNYYQVVSELSRSGIDVNKTNTVGWSAPHVAALMGHRQITKHLVSEQGIDFTLRDHWGNSSLQLAAENDHGEVVRLLSQVISVNGADEYGQTPLFGAAWKNCINALEVILDIPGVDANIPTKRGMTPLYIASRMCNEHAVELLLRVPGIEITKSDLGNKTPVEIAREKIAQEDARGGEADHLKVEGYTRIIELLERGPMPPVVMAADGDTQDILPPTVVAVGAMQVPKAVALKLLRGEMGYTSEDFDHIRSVVASFYSKLNHINADRQDFHAKSLVPATGVPAHTLTHHDFMNAFSRLIYGDNVCVALSLFQGEVLIATNKEDYGDDVLLPKLRSNYNNLCKYLKWISSISTAAKKPLWVDIKLVGCTHIHEEDGLAGNLAASFAAQIARCKGAESVLLQISQSLQTRGGAVKDFMKLLDTSKPFQEAWSEVVEAVELECGKTSYEARLCREFTEQRLLEEELQGLKVLATHILSDFFSYKSGHHAGDLVTGWRAEYNTRCPTNFKKIYDKVKSEVRDFLRDLIILETFASHHPQDPLVVTFTSPHKLKIINDEGDAVSDIDSVFPELASAPSNASALAIEGIRSGNVHAEMKILQYQLKHGGFTSDIAVSKLCCAFCHLTIDAVDQGSTNHYPGYHGQGFELRLSDWMKQNSEFVRQFLSSSAFTIFETIRTHMVRLEDGSVTTAEELTLLLIEVIPKLVKESQVGLPSIPKGVSGTSLSADNGFLIDFGIVDSSGLVQQYYSLRTRDFVDQPDTTCIEVQLIGV